nr:D603 [uncultured bacterium]
MKLLHEKVVVGDYYKERYEDWKQEFNAGEAGIFTVSAANGADVIERILNQ